MKVNIYLIDCNCVFYGGGEFPFDFFQAHNEGGPNTHTMTAHRLDDDEDDADEEEDEETEEEEEAPETDQASPKREVKSLFGLCFHPHGVTIL